MIKDYQLLSQRIEFLRELQGISELERALYELRGYENEGGRKENLTVIRRRVSDIYERYKNMLHSTPEGNEIGQLRRDYLVLSEKEREILNKRLRNLPLPSVLKHQFNISDFQYIGDLVTKSIEELRSGVHGYSMRSIRQIDKFLSKYGLFLGMKIDYSRPEVK